jgi:hypothetical protein
MRRDLSTAVDLVVLVLRLVPRKSADPVGSRAAFHLAIRLMIRGERVAVLLHSVLTLLALFGSPRRQPSSGTVGCAS